MPSENIVKLNIGGTKFETSKSTLTKIEGMFKTMLEQNIPIIEKDDSGCIFIDRDPRFFHVILNFMRDGKVELPNSELELKEIQNEAENYSLSGLIELCTEKLLILVKAKSPFDQDIKVLHNDSEMIQVTLEPKKPVLIIYYHVDIFGKFMQPRELDAHHLLGRYENKMNIFFRAFTRDLPISQKPTQWTWSLHYRKGSSFPRTLKTGENWSAVLEENIDSFFKQHNL